MQISPFFSFKKKQAIKTLLFLFTFILFGCSQSCLTQVSALHSYNGPRTKKATNALLYEQPLNKNSPPPLMNTTSFFKVIAMLKQKAPMKI